MEGVRDGSVVKEDLRISKEMLLAQADVAESARASGRWRKISAARRK